MSPQKGKYMSNRTESPELVKKVVHEVSTIVSEMAGIQLGEKQESMVENRLRTRLLKLGIARFEEYLTYLKGHKEAESQALLSLLTTHHTYFFREFSHFEYLLNHSLNPLIELARTRADKTIRIWSAACSRGQEVYSLAMFFNFHLRHIAPDVKFEISASDVDPESVTFAKNGVYKTEELKQCPAMYMEGNWTRGTGDIQDYSKVKDFLKSFCKFQTVNLFTPDSFLANKKFDLIFCRNVFIYFKPEQIKDITNKFLQHLDPKGYIYLGVSESLNGLELPIALTGPSVYRHKEAVSAKPTRTRGEQYKVPSQLMNDPKLIKAFEEPTPQEQKIYEVLCVDDSQTIHALLAKILTPDNHFKIKAKAMNGREALDILKNQKFDIITLDLHMPEIDGVGFLKEYKGEAPVVVLSSINRDDPSVAQQAIKLGAKDYIEKPSLENFAQACNEIRGKLKTTLSIFGAKSSVTPSSKTDSQTAAANAGSSSTSTVNSVKASTWTKPSSSSSTWKSPSTKPTLSLVKPLAKSGAKPLTKSLAKPLTKPLAKPLTKPLAKPLSKPLANPSVATAKTGLTPQKPLSLVKSSVKPFSSSLKSTSQPVKSAIASSPKLSLVKPVAPVKPAVGQTKTTLPTTPPRAPLGKFVAEVKAAKTLTGTATSVNAKATVLSKKVKTLIVDDSATIRKLLRDILSEDPQIEVVAEAERPSDVEKLIIQHRPDVITLDIHMPEMDGVTLLKQFLPLYKIPTIMISSISKEEGPYVLDALEFGAVDYIQKPQMKSMAEAAQLIRERVKVASQIKVKLKSNKTVLASSKRFTDIDKLILIGSSTGGTEALKEVFLGLPKEIPPILVVQHIPPVFSAAFAQRLNSLLPFEVKEAQDGDVVKPNQVLIAPGGLQMGLKKLGDKLVIQITDDPPMNRHKPSVDYMFKSVASLKVPNIVAGILTGMGADGARELVHLREQGARTFAQDEATSVVYGMPKEAFEQGGAESVVPLEKIANHIVDLSHQTNRKVTKTG